MANSEENVILLYLLKWCNIFTYHALSRSVRSTIMFTKIVSLKDPAIVKQWPDAIFFFNYFFLWGSRRGWLQTFYPDYSKKLIRDSSIDAKTVSGKEKMPQIYYFRRIRFHSVELSQTFSSNCSKKQIVANQNGGIWKNRPWKNSASIDFWSFTKNW